MKFVVAAMLVLLMQQHDPMQHMPGMQMPHEHPKKKPAKPSGGRTGASPVQPVQEVQPRQPRAPVAPPDIKVVVAAPLSSSAIAALRPASTLKADEFDAPGGPR